MSKVIRVLLDETLQSNKIIESKNTKRKYVCCMENMWDVFSPGFTL